MTFRKILEKVIINLMKFIGICFIVLNKSVGFNLILGLKFNHCIKRGIKINRWFKDELKINH